MAKAQNVVFATSVELTCRNIGLFCLFDSFAFLTMAISTNRLIKMTRAGRDIYTRYPALFPLLSQILYTDSFSVLSGAIVLILLQINGNGQQALCVRLLCFKCLFYYNHMLSRAQISSNTSV